MKLYAMGDIHGCYEEFSELIYKILDDVDGQSSKLVFLGDYVDRGPNSAGVVDFLNDLRLSSTHPHMEYVFLKGNHEDMLIKGVLDKSNREQADMFYWNGGTATMESYKNNNLILEDHRSFYESLERYHRHGDFFFVHAGLPPADTMEVALKNYSWIDDDPCLWSRAWNDHDGVFPDNVFVIHGHTPVPEIDYRPNQINIDTGCVFGYRENIGYGQLTAVRLDGRTKEEIKVFQVKRKTK